MPAEPRAPIPVSRHQLIVTTPRCISLDPLANCGLIKVDENPFAELLDRGQPVRILRKRGAAHRKLNILEVAVSTGRGSLESSEAVEAGDFAQTMDRNHVLKVPYHALQGQ